MLDWFLQHRDIIEGLIGLCVGIIAGVITLSLVPAAIKRDKIEAAGLVVCGVGMIVFGALQFVLRM